jgi:integrase/recombinase XerD
MLLVRGTGDNQGLVLLHARAIEAIALAGSCRRVLQRDAHPMAVPLGPQRHQGFDPTGALLEIKEAAVAAGLASPERVSPHVLRHAFATHMHSRGTDLRVLQEFLGHAGIETTQIYTHLDTSRLSQMVRDLHPLNEEQQDGRTTAA